MKKWLRARRSWRGAFVLVSVWIMGLTAGEMARAVGPIAPATGQPKGALTGRIVYTSGGHGWTYQNASASGTGWGTQRGVVSGTQMVEDFGNLDQMTMFAYYCFNAGAIVVPFRPIGNQTNEVILDNTSPAVTYAGGWADSTSTTYFGAPGAVPYRYASLAASETATATYTPAIPVTGFYPIYTWVLVGANRTNQLYRINHTGGQTQVRIPHHMVGSGWVYLGTYYLNAGSSIAEGSVVISNLGEGAIGTSVVIADTIRFGNGMGDVVPTPGGTETPNISTYPREEECSRYWVQRAVGQGQPSSLYNGSGSDQDDNVGAPIRMAAEMNREAEGNMFKRIYISFHSNASTGNTNTATARGDVGLFNNTNLFPGTATPNQFRLAQLTGSEVNNDMVAIGSPPLEVPFFNSGSDITFARSDYAFGEIRGDTLNYEMDATIVEVAFHDNASDAKLLRDPKARSWIARSVNHAVVRYMNEFDGAPLVFLPESPFNVRAVAANGAITLSWSAPINHGNSGVATGYVIYRSTNGYGFGNPVTVSGVASTTLTITNLLADTDYYFRIAATNAGGESFPSETVGCRRASNPMSTRILFVNGFNRFDRTTALRQTPSVRNYHAPGFNGNAGTMDRVLPRSINAFDYVVPHGKAIAASGQMGFDSCAMQSVTNGAINLLDYGIVLWQCGNQSTANRTFNTAAQTKVAAFLAAGGDLFVSGSEIGWDLDRASGPSVADRNFFHNQLHASLNGDANDSSGVHSFNPVPASILAGKASGGFDDASSGIFWVGFPDAVTPTGAGASALLSYPTFGGGAAGIRYDGSAGGGKVIYFGFPFETITNSAVRNAYMSVVLKDFSRPVRFEPESGVANDAPRLVLSGEPGLTYGIQRSSNFVNWVTFTNVVNTNGVFEVVDDAALDGPQFYKAFLSF